MRKMVAQRDPEMRLLRMLEVLKRVGLGKTTVYRLISENEFPAPVRIGAAALWSSEKIDEWIRSRVDA